MTFGDDQTTEKLLSETVVVNISTDKESARRQARLILRQVQKDKDHPRRALYLILAKAIHAHCFDRNDRAKVLLQKVKKENAEEQTKDEMAMVNALSAICQGSF